MRTDLGRPLARVVGAVREARGVEREAEWVADGRARVTLRDARERRVRRCCEQARVLWLHAVMRLLAWTGDETASRIGARREG